MEPNVIPDILDNLQAYIEYLESQEWNHFTGTGPHNLILDNYFIGIGCVIIIVGTEI